MAKDIEAAMQGLRGSGWWMILVFPLSPLVYLLAVQPNRGAIKRTLQEQELPELRREYRLEMAGVWVALALWLVVVMGVFVASFLR